MKKGAEKSVVKKEISENVASVKKAVKGNWIQKIIFSVRILISLVIGFLPSFLFIALFLQYGSPVTNYIKFLSNVSASWGAWLSAIVISFITNLLSRVFKSRKQIKKILENKLLLMGVILFIVLLLALIIIQLYLYVNFTLRNDILVRLSSDRDNIFFTNNTQEDVNFKISILMNPFCSAQCKYEFSDISNGKNIETGMLNVTSVFSKTKTYTIENSHLVQGSQVLNRFEISCIANKTLFCYTSGIESKRAVLLTVNYNLTSEDADFKNYSREKIIQMGKILFSGKELLAQARDGIDSINNSFIQNFSNSLQNFSNIFNQLNNSFFGLETSWKLQGFSSLRETLPDILDKTETFNIDSNRLNKEVMNNISLYNGLVENLTYSRAILNELSQSSFNEALCLELNDIVIDFNRVVNNFQNKSTLPTKTILVGNIVSRIKNMYNSVKSNSEVVACSLTSEISTKQIDKIITNFTAELFPNIILEDPIPFCCFSGKCEKCCDETCSKKNYPIIFLHGQSINKALPNDYSLDSFTFIKEKLISEGYIDAGAMIISPITDPRGLWGEVNAPVIMTASYFFDIYKTASGEQTVSSNQDNIDTYAIRLRKIIDIVKYRTNKDKVIIVAHSMGGVVARRYIQIFGGDNVDKAIYITSPHHGIDDKIRDYCSVIGPAASCNDLDKDSLFMNELNNGPTDIVPTYNIIGIGCNMGTETGEGVVKNSSQYLDYATNYYVKGTCNELNFDFFHESIIIPDKYPEAYNLIKDILKNK